MTRFPLIPGIRPARVRPFLCAVLLTAGALLGPVSAQGQSAPAESGAGSAPPATGEVAPLPRLPVLPQIPVAANEEGVRGQLRPVHHTILSAGLTGQVAEFPVTLGSSVAKGDPLVRMECDELEAALAEAAARVEAAATRYSVNQRLAKANNISGLEVELSRADLLVARAERQGIGAKHAFCRIDAPFGGVVVDKMAEAYQHVTAGTPLLELVDNSDLEVEVAVPSTWLDRVQPGAPFHLTLDETGEPVRGSFLRTVGRVDPVSQTLRVIGRLDEHPPGLLSGMSGRLRLDE